MRPDYVPDFDVDRLEGYVPFALRLGYTNDFFRSEFYMVLAVVRTGYFPTIVEYRHPRDAEPSYHTFGPRMQNNWGLSTRDLPRILLAVEQERNRRTVPWPSYVPPWEIPADPSDRIPNARVPWVHQLDYGNPSLYHSRCAFLVGYLDGHSEHFVTIVQRAWSPGMQTPDYRFLGPKKQTRWGLSENDTRLLIKEVERYHNLTPVEHQLFGGYVID